MTTILFRYLLAELTRTWLVITGVFSVLTLGLGLSKYVARAAAGQIPVDTVFRLALDTLIKNLEIVLPVAIFLAILLVLGRLCRDNEMMALFACRSGIWRVYKPILAFAVAGAILAGGISNVAKPYAERSMHALEQQNVVSMIQSLSPGQFRSFRNGDMTFYGGRRTQSGGLAEIFIQLDQTPESNKSRPVVIHAKRATQRTNSETGRVVFVLHDGWRYEGVAGKADFRIVRFDEYGIQVKPGQASPSDSFNTKSTLYLMASNDPDAIADWQIRLSVPLSIIILALLALPIGQVPPRAGRYGRIVLGIVLCVFYVNGINLASTAIKSGAVSAWVGVWWVHLIVLGLACVLMARQQGWFYLSRHAR
ncbi:LPS export ABC transporter permease LptF [Salinisphaera sp. USBA-960]|uniref:LPS export ABC transporter permease LptF n=1 Tax=Salinisphaera orenii TaxID=856731 RepID=UPI000DBE0372|nr:LPS export ABC transporter permease LptF [Salifodinibacter halophilus]NNC25480.1 LPS export ABC transporter permease LptF [Salifodinibacter halophilus]